jgi:hypothetical protein
MSAGFETSISASTVVAGGAGKIIASAASRAFGMVAGPSSIGIG